MTLWFFIIVFSSQTVQYGPFGSEEECKEMRTEVYAHSWQSVQWHSKCWSVRPAP